MVYLQTLESLENKTIYKNSVIYYKGEDTVLGNEFGGLVTE